MSEIEKMYENCNIKPKQEGYCDWDSDCPYPDIINSGCGDECPYWKYEDEATYPPFTAKKQLELIKWLVQNKRLCVRKAEYSNNFYMDTIINRSNGVDSKNFEVCLASQINNIWQDLTEQEKTEIAELIK